MSNNATAINKKANILLNISVFNLLCIDLATTIPAMDPIRQERAIFQLIFCRARLLVKTINKEIIEIVVSEVAIID